MWFFRTPKMRKFIIHNEKKNHKICVVRRILRCPQYSYLLVSIHALCKSLPLKLEKKTDAMYLFFFEVLHVW